MGSPDWPRQSYQGYLTQKPSLPSTPYWTLTESFLGHPEWELVMGHFLTVRLAGLSVASSFFATSSNRSLFPNPELYIGSQTGLNAIKLYSCYAKEGIGNMYTNGLDVNAFQ